MKVNRELLIESMANLQRVERHLKHFRAMGMDVRPAMNTLRFEIRKISDQIKAVDKVDEALAPHLETED